MFQIHEKPKIIIYYPKKRKPIRKPENSKLKIIGKCFQGISQYMKTYFENSSIHGLSYVVQKGFSWIEKVIWFLILSISIAFFIVISLQSVDRFLFKSTVISIERDYHYWNTSVPSLTICPMNRLDQNRFNEYCRDQKIIDIKIKRELFDFLESLANATYINFSEIRAGPSIDNTLNFLNIHPENYMELIYNLTVNLLIDSNEQISCTDGRVPLLARQVLTEHGICYMTNSVLSRKYSVDYALFGRKPLSSSTDKEAKYVLKGSFFDADVTIDFLGFKISALDSYIHSTDEVARIDNNVGYSTESVQYFAYSEEIISEENLETLVSIKQRKCRFHHESNLTHFPVYTKNLCLQECRLNLAMQKCNCIPHFYPNRIAKPKPVCNYKVLRECFPPETSYFLKLYRKAEDKIVAVECHCLQNCVDTFVTLEKVVLLTATKELFGESLGVRMTVENWPTNRLKRQIVYTFTDLMVSIGSTAGLFLGFSVLSLIEILYFFSIRLICHLKGFRI